MNIVILSGRLVNNFDYANGVAKTSIAVKKDGAEGTDFINVIAFKGTAEYCVKHCRKGQLVLIQGSWNTNKYKERTYHTCSIRSINTLSKEVEPQAEKPTEETGNFEELGITDDEDLPF